MAKTFCTLTPDRGDRPELFNFCIRQIERQTLHPTKSYIVNYPPKSGKKDLLERVMHGIDLAKADGIDWVYIIESYDWYSPTYLEFCEKHRGDSQMFGFSQTVYYSIKTNRYSFLPHPGRSSLFCTAFSIAALEKFKWSSMNPEYVYLDAKLWDYAKRNRLKKKLIEIPEHPECMGIKHAIGITGGNGHVAKLQHDDQQMKYIKERVDHEAFEFYRRLHNKINHLSRA